MSVRKGVRRNIKNFSVRICMLAILFNWNTTDLKVISITTMTYITLMGGMEDKHHSEQWHPGQESSLEHLKCKVGELTQ
jgi:hypothetical protein